MLKTSAAGLGYKNADTISHEIQGDVHITCKDMIIHSCLRRIGSLCAK